MRSLELKTLQIKDDIPLYVTLDSLSTWDKNENRYKFVTRNADSCVYTPVYMLKLYPSSSKEKIVTLQEYFFKVCDVGASPQCMWKTDDCDYMSLLLEYKKASEFEFDQNAERIIETFPDLIQSENILLNIPKNNSIENLVYMIEVAYPTTWNIKFFDPDLYCETEFNLIRLHSRNGVSLLAKTRKDNTLVEYLVEENSNNGKRVYGVGDDLHVAFMTFLSFIEIDN